MDNIKLTSIITLFICIFQIQFSTNNVLETIEFEPSLTLPNNVSQMISLKCSIASDEYLIDNQTIKFIVDYENKSQIHESPDFQNASYCSKTFNYEYEEWKSNLNITNEWFDLKCTVFVNDEEKGYSYSSVEFQGKGYGERCAPEAPCNSEANLICLNNTICQCKPDYVVIRKPGSYDHKCFPYVSHNESCLYDEQCQIVDESSLCRNITAENTTCQCSDYYIYDGIKCYSNSSWCDWFDYDWLSRHWIDIIVILIAISTGLCLLLIVLSISFYLRLQARKNGSNPIAFRYPSSLTPKIIVSKFFSHNQSEDKKDLTTNDYLNEH